MPVNALRVFGVALTGRDDGARPIVAGTDVLVLRELAAIVRPASFQPWTPSDEELTEYRRVIDAAFLRGPVLPAAPGTVFRNADRLRQWLDQNHLALTEGLHFVAGRCESRVHVRKREGPGTVTKAGGELASAANEAFRILRRSAVAAVPLPHDAADEVLSAGFLVPMEGWAEFSEQVQEQARRANDLAFEVTGPWPPYDFVRLEFGG